MNTLPVNTGHTTQDSTERGTHPGRGHAQAPGTRPRRTVRGTVLALCGTAALLSGCASQNLSAYAKAEPKLDLATYFNGPVQAHGMFQDRSGQVIKRFVVQIESNWQGNQGTLDERFKYDDGSTQQRVWRLTRHPDGRYTGKADDVVGEAQGQVSGNALNWAYTMQLPVDGKVYEVQFDDWMYLIDERVMLNRAVMSKFGFRLGEVTLSFIKK